MYHFFAAQLSKVTRKVTFPAVVLQVILKLKINQLVS